MTSHSVGRLLQPMAMTLVSTIVGSGHKILFFANTVILDLLRGRTLSAIAYDHVMFQSLHLVDDTCHHAISCSRHPISTSLKQQLTVGWTHIATCDLIYFRVIISSFFFFIFFWVNVLNLDSRQESIQLMTILS